MNKNTFVVVVIILLAVLIALFIFTRVNENSQSPSEAQNSEVQNVEVRDGVQYVTIDAKGGYFPNITKVTASLPTKLVVKTEGTYDCSAVLVIRDVNFQKTLSPTGEEVIDLGILQPGQEIQGTCGMGMYGFKIVSS